MPRVTVHLRNLDYAAKIHSQPSTAAAGVQEKVLAWLVLAVRKQSIGEHADVPRVGIGVGIDDHQLCFRRAFARAGEGTFLNLNLAVAAAPRLCSIMIFGWAAT